MDRNSQKAIYDRTYNSFKKARYRCRPEDVNAKDYYDRGIRFLYQSFAEFLADVGPRPEGKSLDRKDNNGNYEPGNCRWATPREQNLNSRNVNVNMMRYVGGEC